MMEYIKEHWQAILSLAVIIATFIAFITPSDKDDTFIQRVGKLFDAVGIKLKGKDSLIELVASLFKKKQ